MFFSQCTQHSVVEVEGFEPSHNLLTDCSLGWFALPLGYASKREVACGSRDIRDIVSAYTVWFTLDIPHPYTPCGRGLYRQGLTRLSWGSPLRFCLASLIYILIITQGWGFVKRFFTFFLRADLRSVYLAVAFSTALGWSVVTLPRHSLSPLDTLIVSQLGRFVKRDFTLFFK